MLEKVQGRITTHPMYKENQVEQVIFSRESTDRGAIIDYQHGRIAKYCKFEVIPCYETDTLKRSIPVVCVCIYGVKMQGWIKSG
jgi:hypothetical protein